MLTKLPDYIISDCGYPDWATKDSENINLTKIHENLWSTSSIWSTRTNNLARLLPLRETLTDYYLDKLMMKQTVPTICKAATMSLTPTPKLRMSRPLVQQTELESNCGRQTTQHMDELIKNSKRKQLQQQQQQQQQQLHQQHHQQQQQQQQQYIFDKRRSHTNTHISDNDLDQF